MHLVYLLAEVYASNLIREVLNRALRAGTPQRRWDVSLLWVSDVHTLQYLRLDRQQMTVLAYSACQPRT